MSKDKLSRKAKLDNLGWDRPGVCFFFFFPGGSVSSSTVRRSLTCEGKETKWTRHRAKKVRETKENTCTEIKFFLKVAGVEGIFNFGIVKYSFRAQFSVRRLQATRAQSKNFTTLRVQTGTHLCAACCR